jgi:hypothetical protein
MSSKHRGLLSLMGRNSGHENEEKSLDLEALENGVPLGAIYRAEEWWEAGGQAVVGDVLVDFNGVMVSSFESALREGEMEGHGRET